MSSKIEVLISKALIDFYSSHDEFILINNVLKEYEDTKEKSRNRKKLNIFDIKKNNINVKCKISVKINLCSHCNGK